jgi:sugar/nucleoside kinase (ribokinase family)
VANVISIGNTCLDIVLSQTDELPKWNSEIIFQNAEWRLGGQATNFAIATESLGLDPILVSSIGSDGIGNQLRAELASTGFTDERLLLCEDSSTGFSISLIRNDGERAFLTFLGHQKSFTPKHIMNDILNIIGKDDIVHISGFNVLPKLQKDLHAVTSRLRKADARISVDPGWYPKGFSQKQRNIFYKVLSHVEFYEPNDAELMQLSGERNVNLAAIKVKRRYSGALVVKLGKRGSKIIDPSGKVTIVKSYPTHAVDTTGAGDVFDAGFIAGIVLNHGLEYSAKMGNAAASIAISRRGRASFRFPKLREVQTLIEKH